MASSITASPALTYLANRVIQSAHNDLSKVSRFATNFSDEAVQPGTTMKVALFDTSAATAYNAATNNYGNPNGSVTFVPVPFSNHVKKTYSFTDKDFAEINVAVLNRAADAAALAVGLAIDSAVSLALNTGTGTGTYTTLTAKAGVSGIRKLAISKGVGVANTNLVLAGDPFSDLITLFDSAALGTSDAVQRGYIDRLAGFRSVSEFQGLGTITGALVPADGLLIASRTIPVKGLGASDAEYATVTDPDTGLTLGLYKYFERTTRENLVTVECLFGAALSEAAKVIKLTAAA